jgi:hypothetical protein
MNVERTGKHYFSYVHDDIKLITNESFGLRVVGGGEEIQISTIGVFRGVKLFGNTSDKQLFIVRGYRW